MWDAKPTGGSSNTYSLGKLRVKVVETKRGVERVFLNLESTPSLHLDARLSALFTGALNSLPSAVNWSWAKEWERTVLEEVCEIPFGETVTYGEIAERAFGSKKHARAVGIALCRNPVPLFVPCHRVVGKKGLGGYNQNEEVKLFLLRWEKWTKLNWFWSRGSQEREKLLF